MTAPAPTGLSPATAVPPVPAPVRGRGRGERGPLASVALHLTVITACLTAVFPLVWVLWLSLRGPDGWKNPRSLEGGLDLSNFAYVVNDTGFLTWFGNSLVVAFFTTVLGVFVAASSGYAISRMRFPGQKPLMWVFLITQMFPIAVLIVPIYNIFSDLELVDTHAGLVLAYCSTAVPFCAWMLKGYFDTIPHEIDEAGKVDGLTPFGTFYRLALPLAKPGLAVTGFYAFITAWGEVAYATALIASNENKTLAAGLQTFVGQHTSNWGAMTAASVLITIPAALVFFFAQKGLVSGLTAGGTKG